MKKQKFDTLNGAIIHYYGELKNGKYAFVSHLKRNLSDLVYSSEIGDITISVETYNQIVASFVDERARKSVDIYLEDATDNTALINAQNTNNALKAQLEKLQKAAQTEKANLAEIVQLATDVRTVASDIQGDLTAFENGTLDTDALKRKVLDSKLFVTDAKLLVTEFDAAKLKVTDSKLKVTESDLAKLKVTTLKLLVTDLERKVTDLERKVTDAKLFVTQNGAAKLFVTDMKLFVTTLKLFVTDLGASKLFVTDAKLKVSILNEKLRQSELLVFDMRNELSSKDLALNAASEKLKIISFLESKLEKLQTEYAYAVKKNGQNNASVEQLQAQNETFLAQINALQTDFDALLSEKTALEGEKINAQNTANTLKSELSALQKDYKAIEKECQRLEKYEKQVNELRKDRDNSLQSSTQNGATVQILQSEKDAIQEKYTDLAAKYKALLVKYDAIGDDKSRLSNELKDATYQIKAHLQTIKDLQSNQSRLENRLNEFENGTFDANNAYKQDLQNAQNENSELLKKVATLETTLAFTNEKLTDAENIKGQIKGENSTFDQQIQRLNTQLTAVSNELKTVLSENATLQKAKTSLENTLKLVGNELAEYKSKANQTYQRIHSLGFRFTGTVRMTHFMNRLSQFVLGYGEFEFLCVIFAVLPLFFGWLVPLVIVIAYQFHLFDDIGNSLAKHWLLQETPKEGSESKVSEVKKRAENTLIYSNYGYGFVAFLLMIGTLNHLYLKASSQKVVIDMVLLKERLTLISKDSSDAVTDCINATKTYNDSLDTQVKNLNTQAEKIKGDKDEKEKVLKKIPITTEYFKNRINNATNVKNDTLKALRTMRSDTLKNPPVQQQNNFAWWKFAFYTSLVVARFNGFRVNAAQEVEGIVLERKTLLRKICDFLENLKSRIW